MALRERSRVRQAERVPPRDRSRDTAGQANPAHVDRGGDLGRVPGDRAQERGSRRAPAPREAVRDPGVRDLEQLVVRGPQHPRLQRSVPADRRAAHASGRRGDRGDDHRGAVRVAGPPAVRGGRLARGVVVRHRGDDEPVHGTADVRVRPDAGGRERARAPAPALRTRHRARVRDAAGEPRGCAVLGACRRRRRRSRRTQKTATSDRRSRAWPWWSPRRCRSWRWRWRSRRAASSRSRSRRSGRSSSSRSRRCS